MKKLTQAEYAAYNQAYDYFNTRLFDGKLPTCLITLQRHRGARGYIWVAALWPATTTRSELTKSH